MTDGKPNTNDLQKNSEVQKKDRSLDEKAQNYRENEARFARESDLKRDHVNSTQKR